MQTQNEQKKKDLKQGLEIPTITVMFQGDKSVAFKNHTVLQIAEKLLSQTTFVNLQPMLIVFSGGKQLYFNKNQWHQFYHNQISINELFETTETNGLFRNKEMVIFKDKLEVDPGALWTKKNNHLFLVDDDWSINVKFNPKLFAKINL